MIKIQPKYKDKEAGIFLILGLPPTIIESQVILNGLSMIKEGINIEIWSFCSTRESYNEARRQISKLNGCGVAISLFRGVQQGVPFSEFINALILGYWLLRYKKNPSFIQCRAEYATTISILLKPIIRSKVIWDARGDTESEYRLYIKELSMIKRLLSPITLLSIRLRLMFSKTFADWCIFVSDSLRDLYIGKNKYNTVVIPCVADKNYFFFSSEMREITRNTLRFSPTDVVLIYSGSMALWQCTDETIKLIKDHLITSHNHKVIILTPDVENFLSHFSSDLRDRLFCRSVSLIDVNKYLNAADFGFLLRRPGPINRVASPTKFAEYCLAGLPVITTHAVEQVYKLGTQLGNLIIYEFGQELELPELLTDVKRYRIAERAKRVLSRGTVLDKYLSIYQRRSKTCR